MARLEEQERPKAQPLDRVGGRRGDSGVHQRDRILCVRTPRPHLRETLYTIQIHQKPAQEGGRTAAIQGIS